MIEHNKSLKAFNSFGFDQTAEHFAAVSNETELLEVLTHARQQDWPTLMIGEGSNLVLTQDVPGIVIQQTNKQIHIEPAGTAEQQHVLVSAGVNWHELVLHTLQANIRGLENLSLIPGSVGAAPVQNIGAYGVEIKDRIDYVKALHLPTMQWQSLTVDECEFTYRNSLFKRAKNDFVITKVAFNLGDQHELALHYQPLADYLSAHVEGEPTAKQVSDAVITIRQSKLPNPADTPNAGSFFHNPVISRVQAEQLLQQFPNLVAFPAEGDTMKLSAAWMIDQLGFKGVRKHGVGVYDKQALVLINDGHGTGSALLNLAREIADAVQARYGVGLTIEPVVI